MPENERQAGAEIESAEQLMLEIAPTISGIALSISALSQVGDDYAHEIAEDFAEKILYTIRRNYELKRRR